MASHTFSPITAFLFDMDGTLVDSHTVVERCWRRWGEARDVDPRLILAYCHGRQAGATIAHFRPDLDTRTEVRQMLAWELKEPGGTHPIGHSEAFLSQLPKGRWAVVTSAARDLALHRLKCAKLPEPPILIAAEDVERSKPDPQGFLRAAAQLGAKPEHALVFEDSVIGLEAGRAGNMPTLQICESNPPHVKESPYRCRDYHAVTLAPRQHKEGAHPAFEVRVELLQP